ncbi:hypothetical protein [Rahnella contaminans]|uniref:hypothetical protein n=1 Tax=Rahnella contaminans TaxID=2703882 RepID=UPI003C2DF3C0
METLPFNVKSVCRYHLDILCPFCKIARAWHVNELSPLEPSPVCECGAIINYIGRTASRGKAK